jgi:hypothetical protein
MGNQNRIIFIPMRLKNILNESTTSDIIKDLDKVKNDLLKKVDVLVAKKKKLYSDVDIESPMSADEKKLDKDIADLFSQINTLVLQKRSLKKESVNEALTGNEKRIKDGNPANVYYAFYKGQFETIYWVMNPSDLFNIYWEKFKVRRPAGSQFKLNPEFIIVPKKDYDKNPNHYSKLKPYVDKFWDKLQNESVNEGKYYIGYNKGRGQGTGVFKDVFPTYKDAKKELEKIEKQRGGSYNQIAYYVADEKGNFVRESINEVTYDLGKKQYTDKNMTPTEILELAMAYANTSISKMSGGKLSNIINSANDLAKLNGTTQLDAKTRGKQPALIVFLLRNKLLNKDEYVKLYKDLIEKQISVIKVLKNADPALRMIGGAAARAAYKDMKGEFDESVVNEVGVNKMYVKFLAVSKKVRELEDAQKELSQKYFTEKDLNKKEALLTQLKKGTETLKGFRRNLSDIEEKYVMNLDTDTELDF